MARELLFMHLKREIGFASIYFKSVGVGLVHWKYPLMRVLISQDNSGRKYILVNLETRFIFFSRKPTI
ncbi:hypothetical protein CF651_21090 [Paenibacillus rigui]|uniref:Uncharacterized protein n=1 Tax=Paenibacillus rigui TaxID=554312 RepID=A0A229ULN2_9BACL|nr:hypothetical protein CF651_21090 [Paenibacillus rigui]